MRAPVRIAWMVLLGLAAFAARGDRLLTPHQLWALQYASVVGTSYYAEPLPEDYRFEQTLQAVLITESSLCRHKRGIDRAGYGCGQLHRTAAHLANGAPVNPRKLSRNDALNIRLAARYLSFCLQRMSSWERGVVCYNKGPRRAARMSAAAIAADGYLKAVRRRMQEAEQLTASLD